MPIEFSRRAEQVFSPAFQARVLQIYSHFPELQEKRIACGSMKRRGWIEGTATGWTSPPVFRLQANVSNYTIAHELTHLVQGNGSGIPHGEVACDIWTVDRMPAELLDQRPYYLLKNCRVDWKQYRAAVKELCRQAIEIRKTQRTYMRDAEKDSKPELVKLCNAIKEDEQNHLKMLREELIREVKENKLK